jgi:hypothetical protein
LSGGTDQPASICPDMTWVRVSGMPPEDTSFGFTPAASASAWITRWVEEPGRE